MELRQRIRDFNHEGRRWIASLVASGEDGVWRGYLRFFPADPSVDTSVDDTLAFEAYAATELVAQASAMSVDEFQLRLKRADGKDS